MGIIAGSLPTLKPLFKRALDIYSTKRSRPYASNTGNYRLSKMSKGGSKNVTLASGNHGSTIAPDRGALRLSADHFTSAAYANKDSGMTTDNSSEEMILPQSRDDILCTTEVSVSRHHPNVST